MNHNNQIEIFEYNESFGSVNFQDGFEKELIGKNIDRQIRCFAWTTVYDLCSVPYKELESTIKDNEYYKSQTEPASLNNIINKDLSLYKDEEKGIMFYLNTISLLVRVDSMELDKEQYKIALFDKKIENLDYKEETIKRLVPKNQITKDDKDKYTLTTKEVIVKKVWNVVNPSGVFKSFTNKDEALQYAEAINNGIVKNFI